MGNDPAHRPRHNDVECPTPEEPSLADLGRLTREMSESMLTWSHQLTRLGEQLTSDQNLNDRTEFEHLFQNTRDAANYLSPQLLRYCRFRVPFGGQGPRQLTVFLPESDESALFATGEISADFRNSVDEE